MGDFREQIRILYQRIQGEDCFSKRNWIAAFVVTPGDETLFAGIYRKLGIGKLPSQLQEYPASGKPVSDETHYYYDLALDDRLSDFVGRLTIEWGDGFRAWIQKADSKLPETKRLSKSEKTYKTSHFLAIANSAAISLGLNAFGHRGV